jgi:hypothetical protein
MKIPALFLIMFLLAACARESKDKANPTSKAIPPEAIGHKSVAGLQSPAANPLLIARRLRENYGDSTAEDNYPIINRGKFGQSAIIISRPAHYSVNADAERDTLQTTWQSDLAVLPSLSEEISARFRQHGLQDANLVFLSVVDLWKVREEPMTVVLNLWLATDLHEEEKPRYDPPEFYSRRTYLSVIAAQRQNTWQLQVLGECYDEVVCEHNEGGSDYHEVWDIADLDDDGNNEIVFQVSTCSECYELRVYAMGNDGHYILVYSGGGEGA